MHGLLLPLSESLNPDEGMGMSVAGTEVVVGGTGRGQDDSPSGNKNPEDPATGGSLYNVLMPFYLFPVHSLSIPSQGSATFFT